MDLSDELILYTTDINFCITGKFMTVQEFIFKFFFKIFLLAHLLHCVVRVLILGVLTALCADSIFLVGALTTELEYIFLLGALTTLSEEHFLTNSPPCLKGVFCLF